MPSFGGRVRSTHAIHRGIAWVIAPLWVPLVPFWLRTIRGYRVADHEALRERFARLREETDGPLLICANHLTMIDSIVLAWGLASSWKYIRDFDALPWNTPERTNFASGVVTGVLAFFGKCIPIRRGGERSEVARVLERMQYVLSRGELALIFPEGGRSRTGRVETDSAAWGVGRIVGGLPGCRVLCVYMRGDHQETWGGSPPRGDTLRFELAEIEPKSDLRGVRRTRDLSEQIIAQLARMEEAYFARRARDGATTATARPPTGSAGPTDSAGSAVRA